MQTAGPQKGLAGDVLGWDQGCRQEEWGTRKVNKLLLSREARRGEASPFERCSVGSLCSMSVWIVLSLLLWLLFMKCRTLTHTYTSGPQSQSGSKITNCQNRTQGIQRAASGPLFISSSAASPYHFLFLPFFPLHPYLFSLSVTSNICGLTSCVKINFILFSLFVVYLFWLHNISPCPSPSFSYLILPLTFYQMFPMLWLSQLIVKYVSINYPHSLVKSLRLDLIRFDLLTFLLIPLLTSLGLPNELWIDFGDFLIFYLHKPIIILNWQTPLILHRLSD